MYEAFEHEVTQSNKPRLLISVAMSAGKGTLETAYQIPEIQRLCNELLEKPKCPAERLMVGFGAYASTFTLTNPANRGLDGPTSGLGAARAYTQEAGTLAYFEVCSLLKGATEVWNAPQEVPYAYRGINLKPFTLYLIITSSVPLPRHLPCEGPCVSFATATHSSSISDKASQKVAGNTESTGTFCGQDKYPLMHTFKSALGVSTPGCTVPTSTVGSSTNTEAPKTGSADDSGFCAKKSDGLYPSPTSKHAFYNCMDGHTYEEACQTGLVFDTSCSCGNWA
ncbi:Acidic mammalian chitinase [Bos mutus]|uniref:chitinase n=1 Tax=Bos mutus TaxID=72004 RepID=L8HL17_9CETA|nr:Acidic mammalian chitinase [Bos mutus]